MKILIVDDDHTNRMVLTALLKKEGHDVLVAENGQQAVELFESDHPQMVLMDVMMPVMDGYEATQQIKSKSKDRFVPIIFLTALNDENALAKCVECGGDDFLTKPFSRVILKSKLQAMERVSMLYDTVRLQRDELSVHQNRLQHEQEVAERIFSRMVHPGCLDMEIFQYLLSPMSVFNGDILLAAHKPSGGFHILLGDFTGHGLAAAVGAMPVAQIFYGMTTKGHSIGDIVSEINLKLKETLPSDIFLAACMIEIEARSNLVSIWLGGIPDVLVCGVEGDIKQRITSSHLPLGVLENDRLDRSVDIIRADIGDRMYLYSDGVIEASNQDGIMFGQERLENLLNNCGDSATAFDTVIAGLREFRSGNLQSDDTTMIEILCDPEKFKMEEIDQPLIHLNKNPGAWEVSMTLSASSLRGFDPLPPLLQVFMDIQGLYRHREHLYTVLAELYSNALDHGVLSLDSGLKNTPEGFSRYYEIRAERLQSLENGWIKLEMKHRAVEDGGELTMWISDSGDGFDVDAVHSHLNNNKSFSGRGIPLVKSLCKSLEYEKNGTLAQAVFGWS